jgi:hypothetical protein
MEAIAESQMEQFCHQIQAITITLTITTSMKA